MTTLTMFDLKPQHFATEAKPYWETLPNGQASIGYWLESYFSWLGGHKMGEIETKLLEVGAMADPEADSPIAPSPEQLCAAWHEIVLPMAGMQSRLPA